MSEYTKTVILYRKEVEDMLEDYKTLKADHVSKADLRSWCQEEIGLMNASGKYGVGSYIPFHNIINKFCKENA